MKPDDRRVRKHGGGFLTTDHSRWEGDLLDNLRLKSESVVLVANDGVKMAFTADDNATGARWVFTNDDSVG